ncbi:potassium transporter Trk [Lactococcus hodotermopsidis]|uniref:Potassium transporter Trk n=1 Tax=Pseudolactococcus hodotermopsidis TaxID=2709157 RepID=A0A6A0BCF2_9LACT|nr:TrkA family potassium uptake protein [Lactococcus hodotermopsidis]GFH43089.1 potassium transporter Trk [Lactococcus hodotermopsidis]
MKTFCVIGLGRFGSSVVKNLIEDGHEVVAIDTDTKKIDNFKDIATHVMIADATDERVLKNIEIDKFDGVVVAIGKNMQASILTTMLVVESGAKNVVAKATTDVQVKVLTKVGAGKIIQPEKDAGERVADNLAHPDISDYLDLSADYSFVKMKVKNPKFANLTLNQANLTQDYGVNVAFINKTDGTANIGKHDTVISIGDTLYVVGIKKDIEKFSEII